MRGRLTLLHVSCVPVSRFIFSLDPPASAHRLARCDVHFSPLLRQEVIMNLPSLLDEMGVNYRLSRHDTAYIAADLAHAEHVPGRKVIKPVVIKADGQFVMCALPASHRIDLDTLREQLQANDIELAGERDMTELFPECEMGAEPPIGRVCGIPTLM